MPGIGRQPVVLALVSKLGNSASIEIVREERFCDNDSIRISEDKKNIT